MTRHAKNNTALGHFTRGEKDKLGQSYGVMKMRIGSESIKDFDACGICLKQAQDVMCCTKGHIFCRGCILEALAAQQELIKQKDKEFENQKKRKKAEETEKNEEKLMDDLEKFDKCETTIVPMSAESPTANLLLAKHDAGDVGSRANEQRRTKTANPNERDQQLPCFWIPALLPDAHEKDVKRPAHLTICPEGQHPLRLKHLKSVKFTLAEGKKEKHFQTGRYMCPLCRKTLTNSSKCAVLRRCGHVFCKHCTAAFVKKDKACVECGKPTKTKDIVDLQVGGTGFSSHGTQMEATKFNHAFQ